MDEFVVARDCRAIIAEELDFRGKVTGVKIEIPEDIMAKAMTELLWRLERLLDDHQDGIVLDVLDDMLAEAEKAEAERRA